MDREKPRLLNQLVNTLHEGLLVDSAWLKSKGYSTQLQHQYVSANWLEQPARSVFRRPGMTLTWQQVVISLQTILDYSPLIVGGRTALELQGYGHYLRESLSEVHLYGPKAPPNWIHKLPLKVRFLHHNSNLFRNDPVSKGISSLAVNLKSGSSRDLTALQGGDFTTMAWGQWEWPLTLSTPERATLELLDQLPQHETFEQVDALFAGLGNLRPGRLSKLLTDCTSVKVKRLFFFFADRHQHAWRRHLSDKNFDLGSGKRMLVKGGTLNRAYQITVPEDMNGVR